MEAETRYEYKGVKLTEDGPYQTYSINQLKEMVVGAQADGDQDLADEISAIIKNRHQLFGMDAMLAYTEDSD